MSSTPLELVKAYNNSALSSDTAPLAESITPYLAPEVQVRASCPIDEASTVAQVAEKVWRPLKTAFNRLQREEHISMDGVCDVDGKTWVASTGVYSGVFIQDLFGIPATGRSATLRYGEYFCCEDNRITQIAILWDFVDLTIRAGCSILPPSLGDEALVAPPLADNGLQYGSADKNLSKNSRSLVMTMLAGILVDRQNTDMRPREYWSEDMIWYGPSGIGTYRRHEGFARYRSAFLNSFPDRRYGPHEGLIAKNNFVAVLGWAGVRATHKGVGWLGLAPTGKPVSMRLMDFWRVENDRIAENWVLLDIPDVLRQLGFDFFGNVSRLHHKTEFPPAAEPQLQPEQSEDEQRFEDYLRSFIEHN